MTYLGFLIGFLILPITILLLWWLFQHRAGKDRLEFPGIFPKAYSFLLLAAVALLYTTPWDNYLVATGVWWYDPSLVLGITIGWVPLEEYLFFILQPVLGGLIMLFLLNLRLINAGNEQLETGVRKWSLPIVVLLWIISLGWLFYGKPALTYLSLELVWALPVIILQLSYGADILWKYKRLILVAILTPTLFLSLADSIAIGSGVWTIDPQQSSGLLLGGVLPIEEFVFFLLTNIMVVFGFLLIWSDEAQERFLGWWGRIRHKNKISHLQKEL